MFNEQVMAPILLHSTPRLTPIMNIYKNMSQRKEPASLSTKV